MRVRFSFRPLHPEFAKFIFCALTYCAGALSLSFITLGQINLAPFSSIYERDDVKKRWNNWTIWLHQPEGPRLLRAGAICMVGLLLWIAAGFALHSYTQASKFN